MTRERGALMVERRPFRAAARPVPESVGTPFVWAAAFAGALLTVGVFSAGTAWPTRQTGFNCSSRRPGAFRSSGP